MRPFSSGKTRNRSAWVVTDRGVDAVEPDQGAFVPRSVRRGSRGRAAPAVRNLPDRLDVHVGQVTGVGTLAAGRGRLRGADRRSGCPVTPRGAAPGAGAGSGSPCGPRIRSCVRSPAGFVGCPVAGPSCSSCALVRVGHLLGRSSNQAALPSLRRRLGPPSGGCFAGRHRAGRSRPGVDIPRGSAGCEPLHYARVA